MNPVDKDLTVHHPLFMSSLKHVFKAMSPMISPNKPTKKKKKATLQKSSLKRNDSNLQIQTTSFEWAEVLCLAGGKHQWLHIDPYHQLVNNPLAAEKKISRKLNETKYFSFIVAVEHSPSYVLSDIPSYQTIFATDLTDVTPRYANKWSETLKLRGATGRDIKKGGGKCGNQWWADTILNSNNYFLQQHLYFGIGNKNNNCYDNDLVTTKEKESIPTSKQKFKTHPIYIIPSVLGKHEILAPDSRKRICGVFKGEPIYQRKDVSTARTSKKWLHHGQKVKQAQINKPVMIVKAKIKATKTDGFQALQSYGMSCLITQEQDLLDRKTENSKKNDCMESLYAIWQTRKWSPPLVGANDKIPVNEYRNVELALLNPGLIHLRKKRIANVAKKLGIPYAPCLVGFEGANPKIEGIVVHEHNSELLLEAHIECESQTIEREVNEHQKSIYRKWRRLITGILTADRLKREYGNE